MWTLTYSVEGKRHVEFVPDVLISEVQPLAEAGRSYRDAMLEVLTINAQLLTLWRRQLRDRYSKDKRTPKRKPLRQTKRRGRKEKSINRRSCK